MEEAENTILTSKHKYSCRICNTPSSDGCKNLTNIFNNQGKKPDLQSLLMSILGIAIEENDNFSKHICRKCKRFVLKANHFKEVAVNNNKLLHENKNIKRRSTTEPELGQEKKKAVEL